MRAPASLEEAQTLLRRRVWPSNVKTPFKNKLEKVTEARRYGGLVVVMLDTRYWKNLRQFGVAAKIPRVIRFFRVNSQQSLV